MVKNNPDCDSIHGRVEKGSEIPSKKKRRHCKLGTRARMSHCNLRDYHSPMCRGAHGTQQLEDGVTRAHNDVNIYGAPLSGFGIMYHRIVFIRRSPGLRSRKQHKHQAPAERSGTCHVSIPSRTKCRPLGQAMSLPSA